MRFCLCRGFGDVVRSRDRLVKGAHFEKEKRVLQRQSFPSFGDLENPEVWIQKVFGVAGFYDLRLRGLRE